MKDFHIKKYIKEFIIIYAISIASATLYNYLFSYSGSYGTKLSYPVLLIFLVAIAIFITNFSVSFKKTKSKATLIHILIFVIIAGTLFYLMYPKDISNGENICPSECFGIALDNSCIGINPVYPSNPGDACWGPGCYAQCLIPFYMPFIYFISYSLIPFGIYRIFRIIGGKLQRKKDNLLSFAAILNIVVITLVIWVPEKLQLPGFIMILPLLALASIILLNMNFRLSANFKKINILKIAVLTLLIATLFYLLTPKDIGSTHSFCLNPCYGIKTRNGCIGLTPLEEVINQRGNSCETPGTTYIKTSLDFLFLITRTSLITFWLYCIMKIGKVTITKKVPRNPRSKKFQY
jgi:hypothetical protein